MDGGGESERRAGYNARVSRPKHPPPALVIHTRLRKTLGLLGRTSCPRWGLACPRNPSPGPATVSEFWCNDGMKSILLCIY